MRLKAFAMLTLLILTAVLAAPAPAQEPPPQSKGQTLYLPVVSHVYLGAKNKPYDLTKTFCFRNRDRKQKVTLLSLDYYNGAGEKLGNLLDKPRTLNPLSSLQMPVGAPEGQSKENSPCLIVRWESEKPVEQPLAQCIMIGATGQQGISFSTTATPIR